MVRFGKRNVTFGQVLTLSRRSSTQPWPPLILAFSHFEKYFTLPHLFSFSNTDSDGSFDCGYIKPSSLSVSTGNLVRLDGTWRTVTEVQSDTTCTAFSGIENNLSQLKSALLCCQWVFCKLKFNIISLITVQLINCFRSAFWASRLEWVTMLCASFKLIISVKGKKLQYLLLALHMTFHLFWHVSIRK